MADRAETQPLIDTRTDFSRSLKFSIYISRALSSWGDRMWSFAVGLYLVNLQPGSLRLPAIYGLVGSCAAVFLGPSIGHWVDNTPRLSAARLSLLLQNTMVAVCAALLFFYFQWGKDVFVQPFHLVLLQVGVILTAVLAQLSGTATSISVTKDWVKVIAGRDTQLLANLNASLRRIDLTCLLLAPMMVSQLMALSDVVSSLFLLAWNIISLVVEYFLLKSVYDKVPALNETKKSSQSHRRGIFSVFSGWKVYYQQEVFPAGLALALLYMTVLGFDNITVGYMFVQGIPESIMGFMPALAGVLGVIGTLAYPRLTRKIGLERTGLIGFGSEVVCLTLAVASVWAPGSPFQPNFAFQSTDATGSSLQPNFTIQSTETTAISMQPNYIIQSTNATGSSLQSNYTIQFTDATVQTNFTSQSIDTKVSQEQNPTRYLELNSTETMTRVVELNKTETYKFTNGTKSNLTVVASEDQMLAPHSFISVAMLLTGIILARFGLWIADLSVSQFEQELVPEGQLGTVSGVQYSLNMTMDMFKFALVALLPWPETFGYLVLVSFASICAAWASYALFSKRRRGHILPFHNIKCICVLENDGVDKLK